MAGTQTLAPAECIDRTFCPLVWLPLVSLICLGQLRTKLMHAKQM